MASKKLSARASSWIGGIALLVFLTALAIVSQQYVKGRIDLTRDRQFTLSDAAIRTLKDLPDLVTVRVVMSRDLPTQFQQVRQNTLDLLSEFEARSEGKLTLIFEDPADDAKKREAALSMGIQEVQLQEQSRDGVQVKRGFFGLALLYGDKKEVFPVIQNLETLEYELLVRLLRLTGKTRTVGLVEGTPDNRFSFTLPGGAPYTGFLQNFPTLNANIEQLYKVVPQRLAWSPVDEDVDVLLVAAPARLTLIEKFRIDQFVMSGKPVIFLTPGMNIRVQEGITGTPAMNDYEDLLAGYGVRVRKNVVLEPRQWEMVRFGSSTFPTPYPYWIIASYATMNPDNPITANLQTMSFPWTSSIDVDTTRPAIQSEPLVLTTGGAWEETGNLYLVPREMSEYAPENPGMHVLAVLQTGVLPSAFAPALSDADARAHLETEIPAAELAGARGQAEGEARVLVVSNALFLSDFYMGYTNAIGNYHFIMNALDYLALDSSLIDVRSRLITEAPLDEEKAAEWKTPVVVANMVLAPLVLVILGIVAGLRRRTREAQT
jgi:ABC-2 type transport system permease protein